MSQFVLVTDSTVDETPEFFVQNNVVMTPLTFTVSGMEPIEDDGVTMSPQTFYAHLRDGKTASTSQSRLDTFLREFKTALDAGHDILYIGFSAGLSGSFDAGCMAAKELAAEYPERDIVCVDSLSATGGQCILVNKAIEMRNAGMSAKEAGKVIEELRYKVIHLITVDDLGHLYRGGRLSKTSALMGSLIGIKPIIVVNNKGTLDVPHKVRGRQKSIEYLADRMISEVTDKEQVVRINHGDCLEEAEYLRDYIAKKSGMKAEIRFMGTVTGSHTGPGVLSLFYIGQARKA